MSQTGKITETESHASISNVVCSFREGLFKDLEISKVKLEEAKKYSPKWRFYRDHIEYLYREIKKGY